MQKKQLKIGIIGVGILGGAIRQYYEEYGYEVFCYDKFKKVGDKIGIGSVEEVNKADIIFICVPTPRGENNECDTSIVDEAIGYITDRKIIVIKSTVIPGTTDRLQNKYPRHQLLFSPEFLKAKHAYTNFRAPKHQIVGYTPRSESVATGVLGVMPCGKFNKVMPATAAEMFKYVRNSFLAVKNAFFNEIYDLCQKTKVEYRFIRECAENDPWIGQEHLDPTQDDYRGFNGMCLPKDTEAFLAWAKQSGVNLSVLAEVVKFNSELLASQNIKKDS